ncbi:OB-fold domain-containing protein (plasmid) [Natrinema zhouii]|uniref:Zn-ribbon domain-containing OB-fold protein n=1 Tax=Natrinema zhouii TaxID=1710539 RepID=UPI001CFFA5EC|nr:OB-fold domain-containing protein [Natrinema zhouii]UHQ98455.1 OB-fold domain-containing protein [Natrinema zhouii]
MTRDVPIDHAFVCESCGNRWYYTRERCPECRSTSVDSYRLREGAVVTATTVHATPPGVRSPNRLGMVRFDGDVTIVAQLGDDSSAGDTVQFGAVEVLRDGDRPVSGPRLVGLE